MNIPAASRFTKAMTLLEVLVVIVIIGIMFFVMFPYHPGGHYKAKQVACLSNLRQISIAFNSFASDHSTNFPWQLSMTNGGTLELITTGSPGPQFEIVSNYLAPHLVVLHCPFDISRAAALNLTAPFHTTNISYFCGLDATPLQPQSILAGDRNLQVSGLRVSPGLLFVATNTLIAWTRDSHKTGIGSAAFADGHGEVSRTNLSALFRRQNLATNLLAIP